MLVLRSARHPPSTKNTFTEPTFQLLGVFLDFLVTASCSLFRNTRRNTNCNEGQATLSCCCTTLLAKPKSQTSCLSGGPVGERRRSDVTGDWRMYESHGATYSHRKHKKKHRNDLIVVHDNHHQPPPSASPMSCQHLPHHSPCFIKKNSGIEP